MNEQRQKSKPKGLSIFYRTLILCLLLIIGISGILTGVFYLFSKRAFESRIKESLLQQLDSIESHFRADVRAPLLKDLELLSSNPTVDEYMKSNKLEQYVTARPVEKLFLETIDYTDSYIYLCFTDSSGVQKIKVYESGRSVEYRDLSHTSLFTQIESGASGSIAVGDLRQMDSGVWMFEAGINKADPDIGEFGGALIIHVNLEHFLSALDAVKILGENPVWVLTPENSVIRKPLKKTGFLDPASFLPGASVTGSVLKVADEGMLVFKDIHINPDKPLFRLVISVPRTLLMKDIHSTLKALYFVFGIAVITISLLAYYFSKRLSKPIMKLAQAAIRLSKKDMSTRLNIKAGGEVGILVDEFNLMAENLERTTVSKNYVDNIIRSMNESLIVLDTAGVIKSVNNATLALLGYSEDELVGHYAAKVISDKQLLGRLNDPLSIRDNHNAGIETVYLTRNSGDVPVLFSSSLIRGDDGEVLGTVCVAQDITEHKKAEDDLKEFAEKLKRSNSELEQFTYIASHDLQEPMRKIMTLGSRVESKYKERLGEEGHHYMERMQKAAGKMQTLIYGLLLYSRLTSRELSFVPVDLSVIAENAVSEAEATRKRTNGRIIMDDLPVIYADPSNIQLMLWNLIVNALIYHRKDTIPVVKIHGRFTDGNGGGFSDDHAYKQFYHLIVEDNGAGFDEKYTDRIFNVFQRLHSGDEYEGPGIGLSICRKIAERHGGSISASSKPGEGSTFTVTLPVRQTDGDATS